MVRYKAKARANKKQKKDSDSDSERDGLAANEYFVGTLLEAAPVRTRLDAHCVSREGPQSKGQYHLERHRPLGERVFAPASALPAA